TVVAWGDNECGESAVPSGLSNVVAISGGGYHSLALTSDGAIWGWGYTRYGQGGRRLPGGAIAISAGWLHNLALQPDGTVAMWGDNRYGQLAAPTEALHEVIAIAPGAYHNLVLKSDGTVFAWAYNYSSQL